MTSEAVLRDALGRLRSARAWAEDKVPGFAQVEREKEQVLARYQPVFSPDGIESLTEGEFRGFLRLENNRRWALHRQGPRMCSDMDRLRQALGILVDHDRPIEERLDALLPASGSPMVPGLGSATITGILLVTRPEEYSVWNSTSEGAMRNLDVFPEFERGAPFSQRYTVFNDVVGDIARRLGVDRWTLDILWWALLQQGDGPVPPPPPDDGDMRFHLERYLHEFMRDNWERLSLGQEWNLYEVDGEVVGYEYIAGEVGRIDLLAHHKTDPRWLVVELKRDQSSDATIGQVLRYMGWVKQDLADQEDEVEGLIIAHSSDASIRYALEYTSGVSVKLYEVDFRLKDPDG